jgi:hypothetical protein
MKTAILIISFLSALSRSIALTGQAPAADIKIDVRPEPAERGFPCF